MLPAKPRGGGMRVTISGFVQRGESPRRPNRGRRQSFRVPRRRRAGELWVHATTWRGNSVRFFGEPSDQATRRGLNWRTVAEMKKRLAARNKPQPVGLVAKATAKAEAAVCVA